MNHQMLYFESVQLTGQIQNTQQKIYLDDEFNDDKCSFQFIIIQRHRKSFEQTKTNVGK